MSSIKFLKGFLNILVFYLFTVTKAAYDQPLRNQLSFSAEFGRTGRVLAAFSPRSGTLSVCHRLEGEDGWKIAESQNGYTWKQVPGNVLPEAGDGDVVASAIVPPFRYLVVYETADAQVVVGGAKGPRLEKFKQFTKLPGRSPTFFRLNNILYIGLIDPIENNVVFYQVHPTGRGGFQIDNRTFSPFSLPVQGVRSFQVFCFESDAALCVLSYSAFINDPWFRPYYIVGKFQYVDSDLKFEPYIKKESYVHMMDSGQSASDFRWVNFSKNHILAIGWNGNFFYEIPPVTPGFGNGFTIARRIRFSNTMIIQTPVDFLTKVNTKKYLASQDTPLTKAGIHESLGGKDAFLLDLSFFSPSDFEESGFQIVFVALNKRRFSIRFNSTLASLPEEMKMILDMTGTIMPLNLPKQYSFTLGLQRPPIRTKIYVDKTTLTVSVGDESGLITQAYNLGDDSRLTSFVIKSIGGKYVILGPESSVTKIKSIWSF